ncbi:two-component system sensor histidine kinase NtrB [Salinarimonas soli]|uniref:histidine kinase n=1 Tax=Salinarimonas soli TaxID=1638099 RepID=A0A5B2VCP5_9HYPH|nr:ATP-binding protein [Salinarimonas soli]KAA2236528.1 PAS domain-containing protein [Salinarimonas soli]
MGRGAGAAAEAGDGFGGVLRLGAAAGLERLLRAAIETSPVNVTLADATKPGRPLLYVNPAFCETTGYSAEEVLGRNCRFLQGPDTDPEAVERLRGALARAEPIRITLLNYRRDGKPFWNELSILPVFGTDGQLEAFLGQQVDVTQERIAAERDGQRQRVEALGRLAGGVAHEINNLLQPMLALPSLVADALPAEAEAEREWLTLIQDHARQARSIVRDVLAFSRGSEKPAKPREATALVTQALGFAQGLIPPGVSVRRTGALASGARLGLVAVEETQLRQVLTNLLLNAAQAMGGHGEVEVGLVGDGDALRLTVADNGPGMDEAVRARIFEPFFTTKPPGEGTGLGLSVVHGLVASWGGSAGVESRPGQGTCITIHVPVAAGGPDQSVQGVS